MKDFLVFTNSEKVKSESSENDQDMHKKIRQHAFSKDKAPHKENRSSIEELVPEIWQSETHDSFEKSKEISNKEWKEIQGHESKNLVYLNESRNEYGDTDENHKVIGTFLKLSAKNPEQDEGDGPCSREIPTLVIFCLK